LAYKYFIHLKFGSIKYIEYLWIRFTDNKAAAPAANEESVGSIFFLGDKLQQDSTMTLHFTCVTAGSSLLPRQVADSIPFSSSKLPEILSRLSINPDSEKAASIKNTLAECEAKALHGEVKRCATSLESMVDFAMSGLKSNNIRAMSTSVSKAATPKQIYTITGLNKVIAVLDKQMISCFNSVYIF
jgi:BURP domain